MKRLLALALTLLTSLTAMAQQKTVNIVTVNNPDMITLKKLASKFEAASGPLWEAFALGVPAACSNVTSLPAQAGDAARASIEPNARASTWAMYLKPSARTLGVHSPTIQSFATNHGPISSLWSFSSFEQGILISISR